MASPCRFFVDPSERSGDLRSPEQALGAARAEPVSHRPGDQGHPDRSTSTVVGCLGGRWWIKRQFVERPCQG